MIALFIDAVYRRCHVKDTIRQVDALTGLLIQDFIEQLQYKVVAVPRLQHLQLTGVKI